jgi:hypothetical protein
MIRKAEQNKPLNGDAISALDRTDQWKNIGMTNN